MGSQRKALAAAKKAGGATFYDEQGKNIYKSYPAAWQEPERYLENKILGAIVFCPTDELTLDEILDHPDVKRNPALFKVGGCYVNMPSIKSVVAGGRTIMPGIHPDSFSDGLPGGYAKTGHVDCMDFIDVVNEKTIIDVKKKIAYTQETPDEAVKAEKLLLIEGGITSPKQNDAARDDMFITLENAQGSFKYAPAKPGTRPDYHEAADDPDRGKPGYVFFDGLAATLDVGSLKGGYKIGLARGHKDTLLFCKNINIPLEIGSAR